MVGIGPAVYSSQFHYTLGSGIFALSLGVSLTQCAAFTISSSDVFIAFITEVPILHLREVLHIQY